MSMLSDAGQRPHDFYCVEQTLGDIVTLTTPVLGPLLLCS
jgi:hypothetical protein